MLSKTNAVIRKGDFSGALSQKLSYSWRRLLHRIQFFNPTMDLKASADPPLVIVDTDPGTDDAHALFMLLNADKRQLLKLIGIVTVNGNTGINYTTRNTLRILTTVNRLDIPVYRGSAEPIIVEPRPRGVPAFFENFHGVDGFGDVQLDFEPDMNMVQKESAVVKLVQLACEHKGKLNVVCLGPLTNVALAMKVDPEFGSNIQHLYIMGGNFTGRGNVTSAAEFNFHSDPEAAHIVLANAKCHITLAPWETCFHLGLPYKWRIEVLGKAGTPQSELINKVEMALLANRSTFTEFPEWYPCDSLITAVLIKPSIITSLVQCHLTVELHGGRTRGQVVLDHKQQCDHNVRLVKDADLEAFKQLLLFAMDHPECNLKF